MMYINGKFVKTEQTMEVINPASGEVITSVCTGGEQETLQAIQAAKNAFPAWSGLTAEQRSQYLHRIVEKLSERKESLAVTITREMGKVLNHARYEVQSAINFFQWYAEEARRVYGETIPASQNNKRIFVMKQPVGVVGAITPWNFPLSMIARKFGPALAVGCTVVLKPSREAPLSALELFKIIDEVELPPGVVNLVIGDSGPIVKTIMESKDVRKISFTGSTEVGKQLIRQSANSVKRVSMELGGHAPFIVFEDADIDLAVEGLIRSKFASNGQQCVCANRVYVHSAIYEEFTSRLKEAVSNIKVGDGLDESNQMGPLINAGAVEKVHDQVKDAVTKGATVIHGGHVLTGSDYNRGYFYAPTVLGDVKPGMKILCEETFGPIAPLIRFTDEDEVIKQANDIEYGLASYFYTNDLSRMFRVTEKLEYGMVGVNDPSPFAVQAPFGGVKESGIGREGGHHGLDDYLDTKMASVAIRI
jgi:succinate-semialdehyde dehydrogenase/glutarate-semialdehyde dehydrogenase